MTYDRRTFLQATVVASAASLSSARSNEGGPCSRSNASAISQVSIAGKAMHYLDQGIGFPLLLGHSYLWNNAMWHPQIDALSEQFRVIVPDLWGHGHSDALPEPTQGMTDLARQHLALLDALEIERCHVVGLSVGGMWGCELALLEPQRVDRLVMMDTYLGAEPDPKREYYFKLIDEIDHLGHFDDRLIDTVAPIFFHPDGTTVPEVRAQFRAALAEMSTPALRQSILPLGRLIFGREDRLSELSRLDPQRTLVMCGTHDIPRPPSEARHMASLIGCSFIAIPEAGHISNLEKPDFVNSTLLEWLTASETRRAVP